MNNKRTSSLNSKDITDIDICIDDSLLKAGLVDAYFYLQDYRARRLMLCCEINADTVYDVVRHILAYNAEDKGLPVEERKPITLFIASIGGSLDAGFEIIDAVEASKTPVRIVNLGYEYSMGFLIGICGHERYTLKSAKFLLHDGNSIVYNSGAKAQDQMLFNKHLEDRIRDYVISHTKISAEEYDKNYRVEWFMFADEAKDKGVVDKIIGVDCDLEDIL